MDAGTQLGPYEIKEPLGKGGMGEVYRARDARLDRDVAIKLLPAELTDEPQRLSRLEREARLLASLNHPNIGSIYGLEETDKGRPALVLELVEGPTLADRISRGPLPVEEALPIILQIAEALEAAHESGIIHRDLKPANVKITLEGQAKVLDFGLAKALEPERDEQELSDSPTLSAAATRTGLILGTAGYMSPEQAKGKSVDRRADIWAFGVVLLEMLTGERTFGGETVSDTLASVIKDDPDLGRLPVGVPLSVRRVLDRCLRKDPAERFHDIADVRLLLEDAPEATTEERDHGWMWPRSSRGAGLAAGLAVVGVLVGVAGMLLLDRGEPTGPPEVPARRFVIEYGDLREGRPALSPDGRRLAYAKDGRIWVRDLDRLEKLPVPGTEGGSVPFWSPDGEWIGFSSGSDTSGSEGSIWKVRPDGTGRTMITTPAPTTLAGGAAWLPDGRIVFNTGRGELLVVPDRGGEATPFAPLGEGEADYHYVAALPDGRGVLTALHRGDRWNSIQLVTLDGERREIATFSRHNVGALAYSPTGHIVFERGVVLLQGGLWAVPFSIEELEVTGEPFPVATGGGAPAIAGDGTLVYVVTQPPVDAELVLVHPTGEVLSRVGEPRRGLYPHAALSPDGNTVVAPVVGTQGWDLWAFDLAGGAPRRLTFENASILDSPAWSTNGSDLFFSMWRGPGDFGIYRVPAYGSRPPELVVRGTMLADFTSDGGTMIYGEPAEGFEVNLWMRELDGDETGTPLLTDVGYEVQPALSPDDRFLAYSHQDRILVRSFPDMGGPWQIGPGWSPRWSPDGTRLYYLNGDALMEVEVSTGGQFRFASPAPLFNFEMAPALLVGWPLFDVTPDGERFIMVRTVERPPGMVLVQNWPGAVE